ncbi:MAG: hypothetical protein JRF33_26350 [Deltaproteobacteria bacterium]|nr:hypothetical protein [Deltaproteobacteria bacterium]
MRMFRICLLVLLALSLSVFLGCGDDATDFPEHDGGGTLDGDDGGGEDGGVTDGDSGGDEGMDAGGDEAVDPCANMNCPEDQHCEDDGSGLGVCINNTCEDLNCGATEVCEQTPGGGAICVDISCTEDIDCAPEEFCDGNLCADDVCDSGFARCQGQVVEVCASNGSGYEALFACGSMAYFESVCVDDPNGQAFCTCEDDWDCPTWSVCESGRCVGTGRQPVCRLDPAPFTDVLPIPEITWGGDATDPTAVDSPFPSAAQVVMTPLVANLDDDNGDGLIDESDFPEIIFLSFRNHEFTTNGVLRAIHGGGPNKGGDYFAVCGTTLWNEGDPLDMACDLATADLDSTASPAVGDLDNDGVPEIIAIDEGDRIVIFDNHGLRMSRSGSFTLGGANPAVALANVDNQGFAEIIIGRNLFTLQADDQGVLSVLDRFVGNQTHGTNGQGPVSCVANLLGDSRQEIVAGTVAYRWPEAPPGVDSRAQCSGTETDPDHVAWCAGQLLVAWDANQVNAGGVPVREGFCSVADVLGADAGAAPGPENPLDGMPEVLTIADGYLLVMDGASGVLLREINLEAGGRGGAPNVDDFDGDGFPELGTAFSSSYIIYDFQEPSAACPAWDSVMLDDELSPGANPPRTGAGASCSSDADCLAGEAVCNLTVGSCVCLHNAWMRRTEDASSRVTGSSVFDFNGDGGAEVIYNDECRFRIYNGLDGNVLFTQPSESRTRIEYPVVADVDNDGNAEIVFGTSNESGFCSENLDSEYNAGIEVWGDAGDFWVSARRIWNQHAYHVTNVFEDGGIPVMEPENWLTYNGRRYNTYRSNPRNYNTAPDLSPTAMQFSSPDAACGQLSSLLDITVQIENLGDLLVGPSLVVAFRGEWSDPHEILPLLDAAGDPLIYVLQNPLMPGSSVFVNVSYDAANSSRGVLPDSVTAIVDADERERECHEDNNQITAPVEPSEQAADLRVELGEADMIPCPSPTLENTVFNDGSLPAENVLIRYYAGDPDQGGAAILDHVLPGILAPGTSSTFTVTLANFPSLLITVHAVVDPDNDIFECNDGNNKDEGPEILCFET